MLQRQARLDCHFFCQLRATWASANLKQTRNFSASLTGGKNLAAVHTLSAEKFLAAVELGGMPMPSVAVTRLVRPYEWGGAGAINLIGKPEMVDPRKGRMCIVLMRGRVLCRLWSADRKKLRLVR